MIQILEIGLIALVLFFAQQIIYKKIWNRHLSADVSFTTDHIFEGEKGYLREVIENQKRLPLAMLKVKFQTSKYLVFDIAKGSRITDQYYRNDVFHVAGGEKITRTIPFVGGKRGYYTIDGMDLVASDLFLTVEMLQTYPLKRSIYVYPRPFDSRELRLSLQKLNGEILTKQHLLEDPFEYRGIREYQPYDDMRSINWKATAKTGDFKVNQKNYTALPSVRIFFNMDDKGVLKKEECVEATLQIVAGLCSFFLNQGIQVSCYGNGADILTGKPFVMAESAGKGHLEQIYRLLARIDTTKPTLDFRTYFQEEFLEHGGKNTITCIVAPNHYDDFVSLVEQLQDAGKEYRWFYPVWDSVDPKLPEQLQKNIQILHIRN